MYEIRVVQQRKEISCLLFLPLVFKSHFFKKKNYGMWENSNLVKYSSSISYVLNRTPNKISLLKLMLTTIFL